MLPGEIFVKKRGSVSITTDQSTSCILGLNQPLAFVQRHQDAIMPWSKKNTERKGKKTPHVVKSRCHTTTRGTRRVQVNLTSFQVKL